MVQRWLVLVFMASQILAAGASPALGAQDHARGAGLSEASSDGGLARGSFLSESNAGWVQAKTEAQEPQANAEEKIRKLRATSRAASGPGQLPPTATSEYLETQATSFAYDLESSPPKAMYAITLRARSTLAGGAYLETHFENPSHPAEPIIVGRTYQKRTLQEARQPLVIMSPPLAGVQCKNYSVVVYVYRDPTKASLLGTHRQWVQSRVDTDNIATAEDFIEAINGKRNTCRYTPTGENLRFPLPLNWYRGHAAEQGNLSVEEYVPAGQTVRDWRQMITVLTFRGPRSDPANILTQAQGKNTNTCPRPLEQMVVRGIEDNFPTARTVLVCGQLPGTNRAEISVMKVIAGSESAFWFSMQWAVPAGDPARIMAALAIQIADAAQILDEVRLCDTRDSERPCPQ